MATARGFLRIFGFLLLTLLLAPLQALALRAGWGLAERLPMLYHRLVLRLLGIRLRLHGEPTAARPTLFVPNHASSLDIPVLGAVLHGSFVAKAEIAGWPGFGLLAKLQRSIFVDRKAGSVNRHRNEMTERLQAGGNVILFPEGTSSDGNRILPFKSALFSAAEVMTPDGRPVTVQAVTVACTEVEGLPSGRAGRRDVYGWFGDMELVPHLWGVLRRSSLTVEIEFHPPTALAAHGSRKALADHCWRQVAGGFAVAVSGRRPAAEPRPAAVGGLATAQ